MDDYLGSLVGNELLHSMGFSWRQVDRTRQVGVFVMLLVEGLDEHEFLPAVHLLFQFFSGDIFHIAVNRVRSRSEEVDFFDVSAWRELGQTIADYKKKGDPILVEGRLQYRTWESQDGSKRSKVDVVADNVQFLGRRGGAEDAEDRGPLGSRA